MFIHGGPRDLKGHPKAVDQHSSFTSHFIRLSFLVLVVMLGA